MLALGIRVAAIERDAEALASFASAVPPGSSVLRGNVEDTIATVLPSDLVVVNPPRAGLDESVSRLLDVPGAVHKSLIYISCDPATLARDLSRLPSFEIRSLHCFDMFPQTAHVETVCQLVPSQQ
jgi:tRNA/tmRNA/rRNA uracil-C5-methylase (TrmA/RlmC/RlmD family)